MIIFYVSLSKSPYILILRDYTVFLSSNRRDSKSWLKVLSGVGYWVVPGVWSGVSKKLHLIRKGSSQDVQQREVTETKTKKLLFITKEENGGGCLNYDVNVGDKTIMVMYTWQIGQPLIRWTRIPVLSIK